MLYMPLASYLIITIGVALLGIFIGFLSHSIWICNQAGCNTDNQLIRAGRKLTIGDCAKALSKLREKNGYMYNPSDREIMEEALR